MMPGMWRVRISAGASLAIGILTASATLLPPAALARETLHVQPLQKTAPGVGAPPASPTVAVATAVPTAETAKPQAQPTSTVNVPPTSTVNVPPTSTRSAADIEAQRRLNSGQLPERAT